MIVSHRIFYRIVNTLACCAVLFGIFIGLLTLLPSYIELKVLPDLSQKTGIQISGNILRVGITGADITDLVIGDITKPGLKAESIHLTYTPVGIFRRRVSEITATGLSIYLSQEDNHLTIPGIIFPHTRDVQGKNAATTLSPDLRTLMNLGKLRIRHGEIFVESQSEPLQIPFRFESFLPSQNVWRAGLEITPPGMKINLTGQTDFASRLAQFTIDANGLDLRHLTLLEQWLPGLTLTGQAHFYADAALSLSPLALTSLSANLVLQETGIAYKNIPIHQASVAAKAPEIMKLALARLEEKKWQMTLASDVQLLQNFPLRLKANMESELIGTEKGLAGSGNLALTAIASGTQNQQGPETAPILNLRGTMETYFANDGSWDFVLRGSPTDSPVTTWKVPYAGNEISYKNPYFLISGNSGKNGGSIHGEATLENIRVTSPGLNISAPKISFSGTTSVRQELESQESPASFLLTISNTDITMGKMIWQFPLVEFAAKTKATSEKEPSLQGVLKLAGGSAKSSQLGLNLKGLTGTIPIQWPHAHAVEEGSIAVQEVSWKNSALGEIQAKIVQDGLGLKFQGAHHSTLFPGLSLNLDGMASATANNGPIAEITFMAPSYKIPSPVNLGAVIPAAGNYTITGAMEISGRLSYGKSGLKSEMKTSLSDFDIIGKKDGTPSIRGLALNLYLPDLLSLRSGPQQRLSFQKASFGDLHTGEGNFEFQIESPDSILVEKSRISWCDGQVYTQAMRFSPQIKNYDLTLYCDRLHFASLLDQFGAAKSEGKGRVNGRIPLRFQNGNITFHDGFLYSTPGEGGVIHMPDTKNLTAGIPMNTPQFSQLDLASEALKDFVYEWAIVDLNTEGEDLLLHMQLDGKPKDTLPFVYQKDSGTFVRVGKDQQGSVFQGIKLDVNFKLPLNQILYYGSSIKKILEQ